MLFAETSEWLQAFQIVCTLLGLCIPAWIALVVLRMKNKIETVADTVGAIPVMAQKIDKVQHQTDGLLQATIQKTEEAAHSRATLEERDKADVRTDQAAAHAEAKQEKAVEQAVAMTQMISPDAERAAYERGLADARAEIRGKSGFKQGM